jgi:hypothetical protein
VCANEGRELAPIYVAKQAVYLYLGVGLSPFAPLGGGQNHIFATQDVNKTNKQTNKQTKPKKTKPIKNIEFGWMRL